MAGDAGDRDGGESGDESRKGGLTRRGLCAAAVLAGVGATAGVSAGAETHTLTVVGGTGGPTTYEAVADGRFETGARAVEDALADGRREYRFRGSLTSLTLRGGAATVLLDGTRIDPDAVSG